MNVSEMIFNSLSKFYFGIFGSKRLHDYEQVCLNAWCEMLPEITKNKVNRQLEKYDLIQRYARKQKSVFYSTKDQSYKFLTENELFSVKKEDLKVFTGQLTGSIGDVMQKVKFAIYVHKGRLSSIEFESELGALKSLDSDELIVTERKELVLNL